MVEKNPNEKSENTHDYEPEIKKKVKTENDNNSNNNNDGGVKEDFQNIDDILEQEQYEAQNGKSVKIVFEYFGSCELKTKKMYCDLFNYSTNN